MLINQQIQNLLAKKESLKQQSDIYQLQTLLQ